MMRKIRFENLPRQLQTIFYSVGITADSALERVREFEDYKHLGEKSQNIIKKSEAFADYKNCNRVNRKCYKCEKEGHIQYECRSGKTLDV
jgi:hypothetical protein